jgi:hypothetical protein
MWLNSHWYKHIQKNTDKCHWTNSNSWIVYQSWAEGIINPYQFYESIFTGIPKKKSSRLIKHRNWNLPWNLPWYLPCIDPLSWTIFQPRFDHLKDVTGTSQGEITGKVGLAPQTDQVFSVIDGSNWWFFLFRMVYGCFTIWLWLTVRHWKSPCY